MTEKDRVKEKRGGRQGEGSRMEIWRVKE